MSAYTIQSHGGETMLETKVTDALGRTVESYTDAKGRNREIVQHAGGENITVSYAYDFERLKEILYPKNLFNRVTYTYGQAGDKYRVHQEFGVIDIINVVVEDNKPPLITALYKRI